MGLIRFKIGEIPFYRELHKIFDFIRSLVGLLFFTRAASQSLCLHEISMTAVITSKICEMYFSLLCCISTVGLVEHFDLYW